MSQQQPPLSKQDALADKKEKLRQLLLKKQQLTQAKKGGNGAKPAGYQAIPVREHSNEAAPLSFAQQRLWFLDKLQGGSPEYNMPAIFRVTGTLNIPLLNQVFNAIIDRHSVLRSVYVEHDSTNDEAITVLNAHTPQGSNNSPVKSQQDAQLNTQTESLLQHCQPAGRFQIVEYDLSTTNERVTEHNRNDTSSIDTRLHTLIETDVSKPFDLRSDLMLRVSHVRLGAEHSVLLFNMHHIASDGWSMNVLMQEFLSLYQALSAVNAHTANTQSEVADTALTAAVNQLPPLTVQYADFAAWQRTTAFEQKLAGQLAYWKKQLDGAPMVHGVPLDFPRGHEKSHQGANVVSTLPASVATGLQAFAKAHQLTPFMLLHAGLSYVLAAQSHSQDIVIGTPVANRKHVELAPLIGFFVNTLVLRNRTDFSQLRDYLAHIRQVHLDAQSHQDVPFERLVDGLNVPRSRAYTPIFQIMLTTQTDFSGGDHSVDNLLRLPNAQLSPIQPDTVSAKFDLNIDLQLTQQGVALVWNYDVSLFSAAHVSQMNEQLCTVFQQLASLAQQQSFDIALADINLVSAQERDYLINTLNQTQHPVEHDICVHQLVERHAEQRADAMALYCSQSQQQMTYQQLNKGANQLAQYLVHHHSVRPNQLIGVCVSRGIHTTENSNHLNISLPMLLLAIMKAGATYVPFDTKLGANVVCKRAVATHDAAKLPLILAESATQAWFSGEALAQSRVLTIDDVSFLSAVAEHCCDAPDVAVTADSGCYALTTSGSTGEPKLIGMPHRPLVNLLDAMQVDCPAITGEHSVIQFASVGFDMSFTDTFLALTQGGRLTLITDDDQFDVVRLANQMLEQHASLVNLPFAMLQALAAYSNHNNVEFSSLNVVLSTAEQLLITPEIRQFFTRHPQATLRNHYGPSETHVCTSLAFNADPESWPATPTIGQPISNIRCYVVDRAGHLLPQGAIGELVVGGAGLACGYLGKPALTAEKFIVDPFVANVDDMAKDAAALMYKTGDLVRWVDVGLSKNTLPQLQYLGRTDSLVKIRGFRVEIGAIEAALNDLAQVQESCVVYLPESQMLYAYVVLEATIESSTSTHVENSVNDIQQALTTELPDYMLPKSIAVIESLPLNTNGKVDKKQLPAPDLSRLRTPYVAPQTAMEIALADCWAALLKRQTDSISVNDNFFDLGGHSLLATRVAASIKQQFSLDVSVKTLFDHQTLGGLAIHLTQLLANDSAHCLPPATIAPRDPSVPPLLSYQQQRLWLLDQLETSRAQYNMPAAFQLRGALNISALERAVTAVVERHEVLRTVYIANAEGQGEPRVLPMASLDTLLQVQALNTAMAQSQPQVLQAATVAANHVFDLTSDVMLQAKLLTFAGQHNHHVLLLTLHHIASDGWSINILMREIAHFYRQFDGDIATQNNASPLPELSIQYSDYAHWQRNQLQGESLQTLTHFWTNYLADAPSVHNLPLDNQRPPVASHRGAVYTQHLPCATFKNSAGENQLTGLLHHEKATVFMALNAAMGAFLARYSNSDDMLLGSPIANREQPELDGLIGFFVNTLVLRTRLDDNPTFRELLTRSKAELLAVYAHQQMPFEQVIEALNVERSAAYNPLFQVMLVLQNNEEQTIDLEGLSLSPVQQSWPVAKFDLNIIVNETDDGFQMLWEYATDLFSESSIQTLATCFATFFSAATEQPDKPLKQLPLVSGALQQQLITQGSAKLHSAINDSLIDRFIHSANAFPDKTAVVMAADASSSLARVETAEPTSWTYQELHRHSDAIAAYLWQQGVRPDQPIGMMIGRSLAQVAAIIGALKTATAYVPLVLDISVQRFTHIIESAGISLVLVDDQTCDNAKLAQLQSAFPSLRFINVREALASAMHWHQPTQPNADSLAYIIYTSGTTGVPKGVMTTHANIIRMYTASEAVFACGADDIWSVFHAYTFDFSVWEFWGGLLHGGGIVMIDELICRSPEAFINVMLQHKVTVLNQTPSALMQIINQTLLTQHAQLWQQLRLIILDGEPLDFSSLQPWFTFCETLGSHPITHKAHPQLVHTYGITETTIHATYREVTAEDAQSHSRNLCGYPFADLSLYIVDAQMQLLPNGVAGQIVIGGEGLAKGYLGNPQLTAERFPENPWVQTHTVLHAESRVYLTGDVGRIVASGELEVLGRMDHQVKIRGFRVELGDVEAALKELPQVSHAVATAVDAHTLGACVALAKPDNHSDTSELQTVILQAVQQKLPSYMVPDRLLVLGKMPLTPNGKVDRRAVKTCLAEHQITRSNDGELQTDTEQKVAKIWADLLTQTAFDRNDSFFHVGGHSLLCVQVALKIKQVFAIHVPVTDVYRQPVLKQLAQRIDRQMSDAQDSNTHPFISIQGDLQKPSLLLVHAIGGDVFGYQALISELQAHYCVITLQQPQFVDPNESQCFDISALAHRYLHAVADFCDARTIALPQVLMGWSFGGVIVQKMAHELEVQTHNEQHTACEGTGNKLTVNTLTSWQLQRVVMLDSPLTSCERLPEALALVNSNESTISTQDLAPNNAINDEQLYVGLRQSAPFIQQLNTTYALAASGNDADEALLSLYTANSVALLRHQFTPIATPVDYWLAQPDNSPPRNAQNLGQSLPVHLSENVYQHAVSADHFSIIQYPAVTRIAAQVARLLEKTGSEEIIQQQVTPQRS